MAIVWIVWFRVTRYGGVNYGDIACFTTTDIDRELISLLLDTIQAPEASIQNPFSFSHCL